MKVKLTLRIAENVLKEAKNYAQKSGRSLSAIVENYLRALTKKDNGSKGFSPRIKRLLGAIKLPNDFNYKRVMEDELLKKYNG